VAVVNLRATIQKDVGPKGREGETKERGEEQTGLKLNTGPHCPKHRRWEKVFTQNYAMCEHVVRNPKRAKRRKTGADLTWIKDRGEEWRGTTEACRGMEILGIDTRAEEEVRKMEEVTRWKQTRRRWSHLQAMTRKWR
jgi:hypothetical protein